MNDSEDDFAHMIVDSKYAEILGIGLANLDMYNVDDITNIYLATIDSSKKLYIAKIAKKD